MDRLAGTKKETQQYKGRRRGDAATSGQTRIAAAATDSDKDASTSGPIRTAAAATAGQNDAATSYPSGSTGPAISYTVHKASRCSQPVGGTGKRRLAEEVHDLAPQYCRPGGPAIANHLIRHDAHNQEAHRLVAFDSGNHSPRTSNVQEETGRGRQIVDGDT